MTMLLIEIDKTGKLNIFTFMLILQTELTLTEKWTVVTAIGAVITALAAVWYTIITFQLLKSTRKTLKTTKETLEITRNSLKFNIETQEKANAIAEFNIYMKISDLLNTEIANNIIRACTKQSLSIDGKISHALYETTDMELKRYLLNPLEDLAKFYEDKLITIDSVDSGFGYLILNVGNCESIVNHLKLIRSSASSSYNGFSNLYKYLFERLPQSEKHKYKKSID